MPSTRFAITTTTLPFGPAEVFVGDAFTAAGLLSIGLVEGDVVAEIGRKFNHLTYPEHTGDAPIKSTTQVDGINLTLPVLLTDEAMMAKLTPTQALDLGSDNFAPVVTKQVLIIAREEVDPITGISYNGTVWAPAAPKKALWIWKAILNLNRMVWGFTDQGRRFVDIPIIAQFDSTKPAGNKLATFGDPVAKGITTVRV